MNLSDYSSIKEFRTAFRLLYIQEQDPQIKLLAWQDIPGSLLIDKQKISPKIFRIIRMMSSYYEYDRRAFCIWLELYPQYAGMYTSVELVSYFEIVYMGCFPNKEYFGEYYALNNLGINNTEFNYKEFTKQLFEDRFTYKDGFVFCK